MTPYRGTFFKWAEQLKFWDTALEGLAIGIDDIHLQGECDDPQAWLIKSIDHSVAVFSVVLDLENTLWDSHPDIGSSAKESLIRGRNSAQQALQLIDNGPPFVPHELGPLVGDVSSARESLRLMSHRFEQGRFLHILSEMSAYEYLRYQAGSG